jgi:murein DD-endopeptidase MepM/ murein hydrolase activator NlpD
MSRYLFMAKLLFLLLMTTSLSCYQADKSLPLESLRKKEINGSANEIKTVIGYVKKGEGFFQSLQRIGVSHEDSLKIINALRDEVEFSKLKVGDSLFAFFNKENKLTKFTFSNTPAEKHMIDLNVDSGIKYTFKEEITTWRYKEVNGQLKDGSTLQQDLITQGLARSTIQEAVNALLCKINFRYHARKGDRYKILLHERLFENKVIETKVLYTSYKGKRAGFSETYFYNDGEKSTYTAHYTEDGQALIRSGLRYPLSRLHIRSHYGMRRHPVTGRRSMHRGVDLRARKGAKVYAVARGKVVESYFHPFGGNKIVIKHSDGSKSYYLHLNSRSVKKGDFIRSHQIIGTVGATGRVTGPHLHFGFKKANGRWMNPMNKRMIATPKLKGHRFSNLQRQVLEIKNTLLALKYKSEGKGKYVLAANQRVDNVKLTDVFTIKI